MSLKATWNRAVKNSGDAIYSLSSFCWYFTHHYVSSSILKTTYFKAIDSVFLWEPAWQVIC